MLSQHSIPDGILASMPTGELWGVGKKLEKRLSGLGIKTALDFKNADPVPVRKELGVVGERLLRELNGISCLEL